jgi:hypothetical protein
MSNRRFIYCRFCNAVHHVTPFDTAPVFETDGVEIREIPRDDRRDFFDRHIGHTLGELISHNDEQRCEPEEFFDPMKVCYFDVTDGNSTFIARSFRNSISEPLNYEMLPRQLSFWEVSGETPKNREKAASPDPHTRYHSASTRKKAESRACEED